MKKSFGILNYSWGWEKSRELAQVSIKAYERLAMGFWQWPWVSDSGDCSNLVFLHHWVLHHLYCIPDLSHIIKLFLLQLIPLIIMTNFLRWKPHTHEHYHCNAYKYMYLWKVYKPMKHVEHVFYDLPPFFQLWDSDFQCDLFCLDVVQLFQCRWQPINKQK